MKEKISREVFDHMVELAALELNEKEAEYLRQELNNQLAAIDELDAIPIAATIQAAAHGISYSPDISQGLREDQIIAYPEPQTILEIAPETEDGYFVVPDIPLEDLR